VPEREVVCSLGGREDAGQDVRFRSQTCSMLLKPFGPNALPTATGAPNIARPGGLNR
jgi:hypothetical protein